MRELLRKDIVYKVSAIILALLFWFYVTNLQNPVLEKPVSGVTVDYGGLAEGLVIGEHTQTVEVRVKGADTIIGSLTAKDLRVTIDLSQAQAGDTIIPLEQQAVSAPDGVEVISTKPQNIQLFIDTLKEKQLPVRVEYTNTVAMGYTSFEPVMTPSIVVVRGASRLLENLEVAKVTVDLKDATSNLELSLPIQLLDKEGKIVPSNNLQISPDKLQVFVPVVQNMPTKTVIIKPVLIGKPQDGYIVARTVVEPETMKISGSTEKLDQIEHILTRPIDVSGIQTNKTFQTSLEVPEGVNLLYHSSMIKVTVQLEEAPITRIFEGVSIRLENQPSGMQAMLNPGKVNVTVKGARAEIEKLLLADIQAVIDLQDLNSNTIKEEAISREVRVVLPGNIQLVNVEPSTVEITISPLS